MGPLFDYPGSEICEGQSVISPYWRDASWGEPAVSLSGIVHYVYTARGSQSDEADIFYVRSTDYGVTWSSPPLRLNTDTGSRPQWMPSLSATRAGAVLATWHDRSNTLDDSYEYYGRLSTDNGTTWLAAARISDVIITMPIATGILGYCYCGDYNYHTTYQNFSYVTWMDGRNALLIGGALQPQQDVYFDKVRIDAGLPGAHFPAMFYNAASPNGGSTAVDTLPGTGWWTGLQLMNPSDTPTLISSVAFDANNADNTYLTVVPTVEPYRAITFLPLDFDVPIGFYGSAIGYADRALGSMATLTNRQSGSYGVSGGLAAGQYRGLVKPVSGGPGNFSVRYPVAKRAVISGAFTKSSTFFVQNVGSYGATVTAQYTCNNGQSYSWTSPVIGPSQMAALTPDQAGVPSGVQCTALMTSSEPITMVGAEHFTTESGPATMLQVSGGFTPESYDTTMYAPVFKKRFPNIAPRSRSSEATVQNISGSEVWLWIYYYGVAGDCQGMTYYPQGPVVLANGATYSGGAPSYVPDNCLAAARFSASGNIIGVVSESYRDPEPGQGVQSATTYSMLPGKLASTLAVAPLFKEKFNSKTSTLQIQNAGNTLAQIRVQFCSGDCSGLNVWTTIPMPLSPGFALKLDHLSDHTEWFVDGRVVPAGTVVSVKIESIITDKAPPIVAVVAEETYSVTHPDCYGQAEITCYDRSDYEATNK